MDHNSQFYQVLGIDKNCLQKDITKAYRKLINKYHPDRSGGNIDKYQEIINAYDILSNPQRKEKNCLIPSTVDVRKNMRKAFNKRSSEKNINPKIKFD
jgi:DnaJ-class molecular chaperone